MFTRITRILSVDGVQWVETVPDTIYRSGYGHIICRSRGKNDGRITGSRFIVYINGTDGRKRKLVSEKGGVRYFPTPARAAEEASNIHRQMVLTWNKTKLVDELMALQMKVEEERALLHRVIEERSKQSSALGNLLSGIARLVQRKSTPLSAETLDQLPGYLRRGAMAIRSVMH